MKIIILTAILLCVGAASAQMSQAPVPSTADLRAITPEDVLSIRELDEIKISPDGKRIAFTVNEPNDPKKPREARTSNVWLVPSDGSAAPRPVIPGLNNVSSPRWSPDGKALAFLSDRGEANVSGADTQIYLARDGDAKATRLTSVPGGVEQFEWSPDGKMIAFTAYDQPTAEKLARKAAGLDAIVQSEPDVAYSRVWLTNLSDGKTAQLTRQDFQIREMAWSPAGDELALTTQIPRDADSGQLALVVVNTSTGETVRTLSKKACDVGGSLRWSPDGRWITFVEMLPPYETNFWLSLAPAKGGPSRPFLKEYPGTIVTPEWTADSKYLLAQSIEGTREVISKIDVSNGSFQKIADVMQSQWGASFSAYGEAIAYLAQTTESPDDIWVIGKNKQPMRVTDFNPQTKLWRFGKVSEVEWKNSKDGLTRRGVLITPPDYKQGQSYPMVVNAHPGDTAWWIGFHASKWWNWGQLLASNGYAVFLPNTRGVTGEGAAMHATNSDWGGMAFQDLMDGVDYLVARKIADPNRLGIGGWSNGGFMTEYSITRTTRFKAAVAEAGHSDFFSLYGTSYLRDGLRATAGESPYFNRTWYDEHSPITFIKNCRTPTLLLHGELDGGVPIGQAYEFYNGLKDAGVDAELVVYPRERHSIQEYSHRIDLQRRVLAWFDKYLKR